MISLKLINKLSVKLVIIALIGLRCRVLCGMSSNEEPEQEDLETVSEDPDNLVCEFPPKAEHDFTHIRRRRMTTQTGLVCLEDYPYTVSIRLHKKHWCGGAIVSNFWILSAAQCFDYVLEREVTVRTGSVYRDYGGQIYAVKEIKKHPEYKIDQYYPEYNLALIKTNTKMLKTLRSKPVKLPVAFSEIPNPSFGDVVVTGYGSVSSGQIREGDNQELRRMMVKQYPKSQCRITYGTDYYLQEDHMCLDSLNIGVALCAGDTGNPAVHFTGMNRDGIIYGIALFSGNEECALKSKPGVYAKVSYSRQWIESVIGENGSNERPNHNTGSGEVNRQFKAKRTGANKGASGDNDVNSHEDKR